MKRLRRWPWIHERRRVFASVCHASRHKFNVPYSQSSNDQGRNKYVHVPQNATCRCLGQMIVIRRKERALLRQRGVARCNNLQPNTQHIVCSVFPVWPGLRFGRQQRQVYHFATDTEPTADKCLCVHASTPPAE